MSRVLYETAAPCILTWQIDLSYNNICGIDWYTGKGTYTIEGISAIADALRVNASITYLR